MTHYNEGKKPFLFVLTSHEDLGNAGLKTGFHFTEMAEPYLILSHNGIEVILASIKGGKPPIDLSSISKPTPREAAIIEEFYHERNAAEKLNHTIAVPSIDMNDYAGIFFPGGHGTMWDFPDNEDLIRLIELAWESGKIIAAVCHGPAALINARNGGGAPMVKGMIVNSFTNEEEKRVERSDIVPFLLEAELIARGARFKKAPPFKCCLATDGVLITGQNPASVSAVAYAILNKLGIPSSKAA